MLIIQRNAGQRILIETDSGEEIWISVAPARNALISVGIDAPSSVRVTREELLPREPVGDGERED